MPHGRPGIVTVMPAAPESRVAARDELVVRVARPDELAAAGGVCVEGYAAAGQLEPGSPYAATLRDAAARAGRSTVLVAVRGDDVVGSATICAPGSTEHEIGGPDETEFRFLAVHPDAWRTGVGEALVAAIDAHARRTGARAVVLSVRDINPGARRMYERLGFVAVPDRDWSPRPGVDLQVMTRAV